jgi:four helix bundle protein
MVRQCGGARVQVRGAKVRHGSNVRRQIRTGDDDLNIFHSNVECYGTAAGQALCSPRRVAGVRHFRELECWQLSRQLKVEIYAIAEEPAVKKDFRFYADMRAAAASAPKNIAEGFARRTHPEFARFLDIARGSIAECQNHLLDAVDRRYISEERCEELTTLANRAAGAVAGLQRYLRGRR